MTNFQQPAWTLNTPRGSNQEAQYSHLPSTDTTNYDAFGRNNISTFEYVVMYPSGKRGFQSLRKHDQERNPDAQPRTGKIG